MATCPQVQTPEVVLPPGSIRELVRLDDDGLGGWSTQSASAEAQMLFAMVGRNGDTAESIRELIQIPAKIEAALRIYVRSFPEDAGGIEGVIEFRRQVAQEFERLVLQLSDASDPRADRGEWAIEQSGRGKV